MCLTCCLTVPSEITSCSAILELLKPSAMSSMIWISRAVRRWRTDRKACFVTRAAREDRTIESQQARQLGTQLIRSASVDGAALRRPRASPRRWGRAGSAHKGVVGDRAQTMQDG